MIGFIDKYKNFYDSVINKKQVTDSTGLDYFNTSKKSKNDVFKIANTIHHNCYVENYHLDKKETNDINIIRIIKGTYLMLYKEGNSEISLKAEDLLKYVPRVEELLYSNGLNTSEIFARTPVLETYDNYKDFLVKLFCERYIGFLNNNFDSITLECTDFYVNKFLHQVLDDIDLINECAQVISGELNLNYNETKKYIRKI